MTNKTAPAKEFCRDGVYWLQHCLCWFGFSEPSKFVQSKEGGHFASIETGLEIPSFLQNGLRNPFKGDRQ